jgi:hypothetical protein
MKILKLLLKAIKYSALSVLSLLLLASLVLFARPLWRHFVTYPNFQKQVDAFQLKKKDFPSVTELRSFRGVLHLHSYWSHDSKGTLDDLLSAAKKTGIDFIFLSDHPHKNIDTFPRGIRGTYDGILIEPGSEKQEFVTWPMDTTIIDWKIDKDTVAKQIISNGGMLFYSHTEKPHNWASPHYQGMEIYNFHTNVLEKTSTLPIATDFIINGSKFRDWAYRGIFNRQTAILANWDSLNKTRKIVGFSAVDCHENVNIRARYLSDGRVQWSGFNTKPKDTVKVNFWNRWLFHEPDQNGWIFRWMLVDTYETSFNFVVNYLYADTLATRNIAHHLIQGHHFTAFKSLADATGFCYYGENTNGKMAGMMGDSIKLADLRKLTAVSPYPARFTLIKDGQTLEITEGEQYQYSFDKALQKGAYRLEAEVKPGDDWLPWIYTNPIYIY